MKGILTDVTRCTGCNTCVAACAAENALGPNPQDRWVERDGLTAHRFCSVVRVDNVFARKQCRHCLEPACVSACPVGALTRTEEGAVIYRKERCLGCRYCMMACPFGIPRYLWESSVPYVRKCTLCFETRLREGRPPACTEACPEKATIFGEREDLLAEARRRLSQSPRDYLPHIFGEHEVGGTAVLYLSPVPLDRLNVAARPLGERPLPTRTMLAMSAVPPVFVGMGALMGGLYWIIGRRMRLAEERLAADLKKQEPLAAEKDGLKDEEG